MITGLGLLETIKKHEKDVDILVNNIKEKDKIIEQLIEKVSAVRNDRIPSEDINIESRVEQEVYLANEQNLTKKPPKGKCKYFGKRFSLSTVLEEHIQKYHIKIP